MAGAGGDGARVLLPAAPPLPHRPLTQRVARGHVLGTATAVQSAPVTVRAPLRQSALPRHAAAHETADGALGVFRRSVLALGASAGFWNSNRRSAAAMTSEENRVTKLFERTTPGVVTISPSRPRDGENQLRPTESIGSGFVWDKDHVITNAHVVRDLNTPYVTFLTKEKGDAVRTSTDAFVVGLDEASDVAVLRVGRPDVGAKDTVKALMMPLKRGSSRESLRVGQDVFAIGNPFGLEHSMSRGIISGLERRLPNSEGRPKLGVIQTDASINPGNSGGPLCDSDGVVVGVNSAILSNSGTFAGVGLAIPMDQVTRNVESIIQKGYVNRPYIGAAFAPDVMAQELQLEGVLVMTVRPGSPAESAGVRPMRGGRLGDVVVKLDGMSTGSTDDIFEVLEKKKPGDVIKMEVKRPYLDDQRDEMKTVFLNVELGNAAQMKPQG